MKKIWLAGGLIILLAVGLYIGLRISDSKWVGVDESVVEKFAIEANRPPHEPLINIEHGDLPLLLFLLAGAAGGFIAGYCFRGLFPPKDKGARLATGI
jgi:ABC-type cobalt transport system substrate-binding protein